MTITPTPETLPSEAIDRVNDWLSRWEYGIPLHRLFPRKDDLREVLTFAMEAARPVPQEGVEEEALAEWRAAQEGWHNLVHRIALRAGFILCREYMARFIESGGDPTTATSIRANWIPQFGDDPGPPRKIRFDECVTAEDMEAGPWEDKDPGLAVEAACYALCAASEFGLAMAASEQENFQQPATLNKSVEDWWKPDPEDPFWMLEVRQGFDNAGAWCKNLETGLTTREPSKALRFPSRFAAEVAQKRLFPLDGHFEPTDHRWMVPDQPATLNTKVES